LGYQLFVEGSHDRGLALLGEGQYLRDEAGALEHDVIWEEEDKANQDNGRGQSGEALAGLMLAGTISESIPSGITQVIGACLIAYFAYEASQALSQVNVHTGTSYQDRPASQYETAEKVLPCPLKELNNRVFIGNFIAIKMVQYR
jgi:hypothetical protein